MEARPRVTVPTGVQFRYSVFFLVLGLVWAVLAWLLTKRVGYSIGLFVFFALWVAWDVYRFNRPRSSR